MTQLFEFDPAEFRDCFDRQPFGVRHRFDEDALFGLPQLAGLAAELPPESVEYNAGDVPVDLDPAATPGNGLTPAETVRRIEDCHSWMVLKNVEQVPAYARFLDRCIAELRGEAEQRLPGVHLAEAFVFVSSPGSVTPFHIDPEHNFLFQLRGRKTMHVFDPADRDIVSARDLERFFAGAHRNLRYDERWQRRARTFRLEPGHGVHVPVAAPHWVQNGEEVSVSFSVTFRSRASKRHADAWQMNYRLRELGFAPRPAGRSAVADAAKQTANRAIKLLSRWRAAAQPAAERRG